MVEREIIVAEAVPLAAEALEPAWDYVDEATGTTGKPFYKRASGIAAIVIGAIGTGVAALGGKIGLGREARIAAAIFGGKYLGKFVRMAIEHFAAQQAAAKLATELEAMKAKAEVLEATETAETATAEAEVRVVPAEAEAVAVA